jgi:hypothetical protein
VFNDVQGGPVYTNPVYTNPVFTNPDQAVGVGVYTNMGTAPPSVSSSSSGGRRKNRGKRGQSGGGQSGDQPTSRPGVHSRSRWNKGDKTVASQALVDFHNSQGTSVSTLLDLAGHVTEFASDQVSKMIDFILAFLVCGL